MLVDCQTCPVRDVHCADCMVTALTAIPLFMADPGPDRTPARDPETLLEAPTAPLDRAERRAVSAFVAAGLVTATTANGARAVLEPGVLDSNARGAARRHAG